MRHHGSSIRVKQETSRLSGIERDRAIGSIGELRRQVRRVYPDTREEEVGKRVFIWWAGQEVVAEAWKKPKGGGYWYRMRGLDLDF